MKVLFVVAEIIGPPGKIDSLLRQSEMLMTIRVLLGWPTRQ